MFVSVAYVQTRIDVGIDRKGLREASPKTELPTLKLTSLKRNISYVCYIGKQLITRGTEIFLSATEYPRLYRHGTDME